jgi:acetoin utilization deacetylase AcuC-like enzyme
MNQTKDSEAAVAGLAAGEESVAKAAPALGSGSAVASQKVPPKRAAVTAFFAPGACSLHEMGSWHPESSARLSAIEDQMIASGLINFVVSGDSAPVATSDLLRVHPAEYIAMLEERQPESGYATLDPDTLMCKNSWPAIQAAAGAAVAAVDAVVLGRARNAFCSIRPPGHHAGIAEAMGFCFVNNIAVAARHALEAHGLERVAIVDFDVHHGNGTEEIFADDPRVLMVSFFQHPFYPYRGTETRSANMVNVPLPAGADGRAVRAALEERWLPALVAHRPEMIFISAGFDAHREDDLGQMRLVEDDYAWMTARLLEVAERFAHGRVVSCLEGGYNLSALGRSVVAHVKALVEG